MTHEKHGGEVYPTFLRVPRSVFTFIAAPLQSAPGRVAARRLGREW